ncbi:MAG: gliding motility-associated C-terminal domain-containing protein [Bacteroidales bacterium]|nr:gliding motility-associated C-terminal domain-containing protein [Bacteroidales bacterium]
MKLKFYLVISFFLFLTYSYATHERAGEIMYRHISGLTYEVTILTYTYSPSPADRPQLTINWGDGTSSVLERFEKTPITNIIQRNVYIGEHTYVGGGIFTLSMEDPNRNYGIVNIPNSVNIPFYIQTELVINPFLGSNNSVELLHPPLDYGCVDRLYIHNPGAYDPDGDSLSYKLTICRGAGGLPIPGYVYPNEVDPYNQGDFYINPITGDLVWDSPTLQGEYNVAFIIEEWRFGQRIGYVTRDLQIQVVACDNNPPEIITIQDTCIEAGDSLSFQVTAVDPDEDNVTLSATGSPFLQDDSPAVMDPNPVTGSVNATAVFGWRTNCSHVLKYPHPVYFKAIDHNSQVSLSSYRTLNILVVGPAPENLNAIPVGTSINLSWDQNICENIVGYYIYRRNAYYGFFPGHCETGVPAYTGYTRIAKIQDLDNTSFKDDNEGNGLIHGNEYCYIVTAFFPDGAESYASVEACATLKKDLPIITNVSVNSTDSQNGSVYVAWSKPTELDTIQIPGPYEYRIFRKDNSPGSDFFKVATFGLLTDTIFTNNQLNTKDLQYKYRVDFYNMQTGNEFLIGTTVVAPSVYLSIEGTDRALQLSWNNNVPWINDSWEIYRQDPATSDFDLVGVSYEPFYTDTGLENGKTYCYYVKSIGRYSSTGLVDPIINFSQENCGKPIDNIPPCPPVLTVETNCVELVNYLTWIYPDTCEFEDSIYYNIYYSLDINSDYSLIYTTDTGVFSYEFFTNPPSIVGCYSIVALDSVGNESLFSNVECVDIDECGTVWFPNVITPNGDGKNEYFFADSVSSVQKFRISIFNRWGNVVYDTEDPFFKWDGKDQNNNQDCAEGVYFYEGVISLYTLHGPVEKRIKGSITILK